MATRIIMDDPTWSVERIGEDGKPCAEGAPALVGRDLTTTIVIRPKDRMRMVEAVTEYDRASRPALSVAGGGGSGGTLPATGTNGSGVYSTPAAITREPSSKGR